MRRRQWMKVGGLELLFSRFQRRYNQATIRETCFPWCGAGRQHPPLRERRVWSCVHWVQQTQCNNARIRGGG